MTRAILLLTLTLAGAADARQEPDAPTFERDVRPILKAWCFRCHGDTPKPKGGLDLRLVRTALRGGKKGRPAIVPGDRNKSPLYTLVLSGEMPETDDKPGKVEIDTIGRWIDAGARTARPEPETPEEADHVSPEESGFWSHRPVRRPPVPDVAGLAHPVDRFLAARRSALGLVARDPAPKEVLLRRVTFDLRGLPPSPEELRAFLKDDAPDAYEKVVDRLLASPRFGERWGRHWMDVWRYCDETVEPEGDKFFYFVGIPQLWRWRDWIIDSLNAGKGYDRMILEMLAGDEVAPLDPQVLRATGFLARNRQDLGGRDLWLQSIVEHTGSAFLGVTFKCARCHNHKYDPVPQDDYYRLRAFFEPLDARVDRVPGQRSTFKDGVARAFDRHLGAPTFVYDAGNPLAPEKDKKIVPGVPRIFSPTPISIEPVPLPPRAVSPGLDPALRKEDRAALEDELKKARERLAALGGAQGLAAALDLAASGLETSAVLLDLDAFEAALAADDAANASGPDAASLAKKAARLQQEAQLQKAEAKLARARATVAADKAPAAAKAKASLPDLEKDVAAAREQAKKDSPSYKSPYESYPKQSSGRRLALARWIGSPQNPRTAAVAVNHVWMRHFGTPIVASVDDFGHAGKKPTHPELLDWLAAEFMEGGWSFKKLHRLIVTSEAYRMSSARMPGHENERRDPDNVFLWRMNGRRLEAEALRDGLLAVAGTLDLTAGGPPLDPAQADRVPRRSVYFRHRSDESSRAPFLTLFDSPNPEECYRRPSTIVPQQALALANSGFAADCSVAAARRLAARTDAADFVRAAFELALGRAPTPGELGDCLAYLERGPKDVARERLLHVLVNHNDFITIR
jgi:hypothetical protein